MKELILGLKAVLRNRHLTDEERESIYKAIEALREYDAETRLKAALIENIGRNYIFNAKSDYGQGWNAATRGILDLLDPTQERYKKEA